MVTVQPHIRASWGGTLGTPAQEVWTNSIALMALNGGDVQFAGRDYLNSKLPDLRTAIQKWFHGGAQQGYPYISSTAKLTWVKLNMIGADGKYTGAPNTLEFSDGPTGGGSPTGDAQTIWQQSAVITFLTGVDRGRGSHGRIYPPACGAPVGQDGYMDATIVANMQSAAVNLIGDLNKLVTPVNSGNFNTVWNACVVSAASKGRPPLLSEITRLYVDAVPDVQRRRVNRLAPKHSAPTTVYINIDEAG